jgi:hypothetical protein
VKLWSKVMWHCSKIMQVKKRKRSEEVRIGLVDDISKTSYRSSVSCKYGSCKYDSLNCFFSLKFVEVVLS